MATKRTIEVDDTTAAALEARAAEAGLSVSELLAEIVARHAELDEAWRTRHPFATFSEWFGEADQRAYANL